MYIKKKITPWLPHLSETNAVFDLPHNIWDVYILFEFYSFVQILINGGRQSSLNK